MKLLFLNFSLEEENEELNRLHYEQIPQTHPCQ